MSKLILTVFLTLLAAGTSYAQMGMGGGMGNGGQGNNSGQWNNGGQGSTGDCWDLDDSRMGRHMGCGWGFGTSGSGSMVSKMMGGTLAYGYRDTLHPIPNADSAKAAFQAFISFTRSTLTIGEIWEYATVFKAELMDTKGARAFDLLADKFTGAVTPEMGMGMMLNASYGKGLYKTPSFGKNLRVTPDQANTIAQDFVDNNNLGYSLGAPETYPGFYKFHTTTAGVYGMDIMVNGYNGRIWMNTILGPPLH